MPAIAGVAGPEFGPPGTVLRSMMSALGRFGIHGSREERLGESRFGAQLHHTLPEDDFDLQPYITSSGRHLIVADARIDNREELAAQLAIPPGDVGNLSDSELLARSWERWKLKLTDRLVGDFAFAVWDNDEGELRLVRGPLSTRPIFFSSNGNSVVFASLPAALRPVLPSKATPNFDEFARLLGGGLFLANGNSFFREIQQVRQGHAVVLKDGRQGDRSLWIPGQDRLQLTVLEAGDLLRQELDRAVRAQSRRRPGQLACMLSSGRDSSAVAASAAQFEKADLIAFTAAPAFPVDGLAEPWLGDESAIAASTAARIGINHRVCRSEIGDLAALLDEVAAVDFQPFNNPANLPWIRQICMTARNGGAEVLAGGFAGNLTISLGGASFLADKWKDNGLAGWLGLARGLQSRGALSWAQIMARSFGRMLPRRTYSLLRRLRGSPEMAGLSLPFLRQPFRGIAERHRRKRLGDLRSKPSSRVHHVELIQGIEPGNKYALACWGVDIRDPTADRRVAELCLSLPVDAYVGLQHSRPAFHQAFKGRLPGEVIEGRHIGAQAADWYVTIRPQEVLAAFRRYSLNPVISEMFDLQAIEASIERWPTSAAAADRDHDKYCNQLLGSLAAASFINIHFPG